MEEQATTKSLRKLFRNHYSNIKTDFIMKVNFPISISNSILYLFLVIYRYFDSHFGTKISQNCLASNFKELLDSQPISILLEVSILSSIISLLLKKKFPIQLAMCNMILFNVFFILFSFLGFYLFVNKHLEFQFVLAFLELISNFIIIFYCYLSNHLVLISLSTVIVINLSLSVKISSNEYIFNIIQVLIFLILIISTYVIKKIYIKNEEEKFELKYNLNKSMNNFQELKIGTFNLGNELRISDYNNTFCEFSKNFESLKDDYIFEEKNRTLRESMKLIPNKNLRGNKYY